VNYVSTKPGGATTRQNVSPGIVAIAVIALILVIVGIASYNLRGPEMPRVPEQHNPLADWIRQKAVETKGDINKLTPEEQRKLQMPTQGKGAAYLKHYYEESLKNRK